VANYDPAGLVMMGFGNTEAAGTRATFVRQRGYDADGYPRFEPLDAAPDEVYGNSGRVGGPSLADSAPMGGAYGDIDLDGFPDLVVTLDPVHAVMQWTGQWPLVDQTERAGFGRMKKRGLERLLLGWGTALLDIDRDGWLDVVTVHGADQQPQAGEPWPPTEQHHVTTHWSGGDFRFAEVTELTGPGQARPVARAELRRPGRRRRRGPHRRRLRRAAARVSQRRRRSPAGAAARRSGCAAP
jgi:hypothetical protein